MAMRNKYAKRSRISEAKIREIVRYVAADLTALQAAALSGLNRNTVNRLYRGVRERMRLACEAQRPLFGVVEVDESFFGARRVKGRRGRGAYLTGNIPGPPFQMQVGFRLPVLGSSLPLGAAPQTPGGR